MSKSRLEKFLYALYSLDSSDLPNPLSRIEELYKCLVTGEEAPSFKPISRVEKYLMAILGGYDADSLPNPLSRVEVLLYKLATGDDNLDDIDSFLSEHEELLAEIIRNGGVGGNIDIEYVLYNLSTEFNTLYNTAKKPVKSAILKGQTLVNLAGWNNIKTLDFGSISNNVATINFEHYYATMTIETENMFKQNTTYTFIIDSKVTKSEVDGHDNPPRQNGVIIYFTDKTVQTPMTSFQNVGERVLQKMVFTIENKEIEQIHIRLFASSLSTSGACQGEVYSAMLIEGDYTNTDIPYFEGMKSVQMPVLTTVGKNLFNAQKCELNTSSHSELIMEAPSPNSVRVAIPHEVSAWRAGIINLQLEPNTWYKVRCVVEGEGLKEIGFTIPEMNGAWDPDVKQCNEANNFLGQFRTQESGVVNLRFNGSGGEFITFDLLYKDIQIEKVESPSATHSNYEPYKSNILTVNEEVELRGIGEVKDELDSLTGELTQRVGEIVLNGSDIAHTDNNNYMTEISTAILTSVFSNCIIRQSIMCKDFPVYMAYESIWEKGKGIVSGVSFVSDMWGFCIRLPHTLTGVTTVDSKDTVKQKFKAYLQSNPITVQYQLATESIKTVDLSIVDQDGNNTELSTFDDLTHVTLSSEGLIPEVELEVATKNEEVLSTLSLEMDDISTTQTTLGGTVNIQSENVDATMIATTEIYEGLL